MQDDIVEAMARALYEGRFDPATWTAWADLLDGDRDAFRTSARAVLPIAMEHAAGIAERLSLTTDVAHPEVERGASVATIVIAAAIRAAGQP